MYTNWAGDSVSFSNEATWNAACQYAGTNATAPAQCPTYNPDVGDLGAGGDPVASMLLSLPISATRDLGNDGVNLRQKLTGLFAQDTWTLSPKLTVNYGVRWDYGTPVSETHNCLAAYNIYTHQYWIAKGDADLPSGQLPSYVAVGPGNTITKPNYTYFQPRLGIS
jgi:outer membrane receptor protein involved in Fe transport